MNTQSRHNIPNSSLNQSIVTLSADEVLVTMDVFFDTMKARKITDPVELYRQAKEFAVRTFGMSKELGPILSGHESIMELMRNPAVRELNEQSKLRHTIPPRKESVIMQKVSDTVKKIPVQPSELAQQTPSKTLSRELPKTQAEQGRLPLIKTETPIIQPSMTLGDSFEGPYVEVRVDTNSKPLSFDEAFKTGDMGIISRLLGHASIEKVDVQGDWGGMTTLPPPVDKLIAKIVHPDSLKALLESYKTTNFVPVSEIRKLQDGDVVNFRNLQRATDGKYIRHFRIVKIQEVMVSNTDYEIHCIANCVFIKEDIAYEVVDAQLRVRMPNTGLKTGTLLRVYTDLGEFFQARIEGGMSVLTPDTGAFKGGIISKPRFIT